LRRFKFSGTYQPTDFVVKPQSEGFNDASGMSNK